MSDKSDDASDADRRSASTDGPFGSVDDPEPHRLADDRSVAKIYYADDRPTLVDAAFTVEDWDWVVGFDQVGTDGDDFLSVPVDRVVCVVAPTSTAFVRNGRRVVGYGVEDDEVEAFVDRLPV